MLRSTLSNLLCPGLEEPCGAELSVKSTQDVAGDILYGQIHCENCGGLFPILAGVAIVVPDVESYLLEHVKGIAKLVLDDSIPEAYRDVWIDAKSNIEGEHIEEDLESDRVNALYILTHYMKAQDGWWKTKNGSPLFAELIEKYWDHGPFEKIKSLLPKNSAQTLVEIGCGVGGLFREVENLIGRYLGIDSSFASIALARHIALNAPYAGEILVPQDLLQGALTGHVRLPELKSTKADFIVGDALLPPLKLEHWDVSASLNMMDMVPDPQEFPRLHASLVKSGGMLIQSCPYIWHPQAALKMREKLAEISNSGSCDSDQAVEKIYEAAGTQILQRYVHVPWLFYKHARQLEIYSTHMFSARKI